MGFKELKSVVHVVRHGEVHNPQGILYGRLPGYNLSDLGCAMARSVAEDFDKKKNAGASFAYCVASPLSRAQQTAAPIARKLGLEVHTDERIVEAGNKLQGQVITRKAYILRNPRNWLLMRDPFKPSWGEPYKKIALRMHEAIDAARRKALERGGDGTEAVMISHQLPIWISRRATEGKRLWHLPTQRECALASVTSFTFEGDAVVGICYNEPAGHLVPESVRVPSGMRSHGANILEAPRPLRENGVRRIKVDGEPKGQPARE